MAVKGLHYFVVITFLVKSSKSTDRQCHNETGRCFWLGTGSKTWEAARTACQSEGGDLTVIETKELWDSHNFCGRCYNFIVNTWKSYE